MNIPALKPSTPATEWAAHTNSVLANARGDSVQMPSQQVPGAFPLDPPGQAQRSISQDVSALLGHLPPALAGYFGAMTISHDDTNKTDSKKGVPRAAARQDTTTTSPTSLESHSSSSIGSAASTTSTSSTTSSTTTSATTTSPRAAGYTALASAPSLVSANSIQSFASDAATENAANANANLNPNDCYTSAEAPFTPIPRTAAPSQSPLSEPSAQHNAANATENTNANANLDPNDFYTSAEAPFTPIPRARGSAQYFPVAVPMEREEAEAGEREREEQGSEAGRGGVMNSETKEEGSPLLTHAGTHARGHTDAEDAQRAEFHGHASPVVGGENTTHRGDANSETTTAATSGMDTPVSPMITSATAGAGHVFTAQGLHAGTTLGAASVPHAGAFVDEGERGADQHSGGDDDAQEGKEGGKEGKHRMSRFVEKMKGKMHVE
ncbi:hypothetical protein C8R46DRAFT_1048127 [Mycena filopes]|nr:hypothetical protein C8R46DRAFT_1048127 [Mycena filopes]